MCRLSLSLSPLPSLPFVCFPSSHRSSPPSTSRLLTAVTFASQEEASLRKLNARELREAKRKAQAEKRRQEVERKRLERADQKRRETEEAERQAQLEAEFEEERMRRESEFRWVPKPFR